MNERIRQLAEQAGIAVWGDAVYMYDPKDTLDSTVMEKFAELIVRECAGLLDGEWEKEILCGSDAAGILKQHFGVEEQVNDSKKLHTCPYREEIHYDYESLCDCDEEQQHQCAMDI
jgi:hypothetical protein